MDKVQAKFKLGLFQRMTIDDIVLTNEPREKKPTRINEP